MAKITEGRFKVLFRDFNDYDSDEAKVVKDTVTGVLYVVYKLSRGGGMTPLLGPDGKPIIEPVATKIK